MANSIKIQGIHNEIELDSAHIALSKGTQAAVANVRDFSLRISKLAVDESTSLREAADAGDDKALEKLAARIGTARAMKDVYQSRLGRIQTDARQSLRTDLTASHTAATAKVAEMVAERRSQVEKNAEHIREYLGHVAGDQGLDRSIKPESLLKLEGTLTIARETAGRIGQLLCICDPAFFRKNCAAGTAEPAFDYNCDVVLSQLAGLPAPVAPQQQGTKISNLSGKAA